MGFKLFWLFFIFYFLSNFNLLFLLFFLILVQIFLILHFLDIISFFIFILRLIRSIHSFDLGTKLVSLLDSIYVVQKKWHHNFMDFLVHFFVSQGELFHDVMLLLVLDGDFVESFSFVVCEKFLPIVKLLPLKDLQILNKLTQFNLL